MSYQCTAEDHCVVYVDDVRSFIEVVLNSDKVKRFIKFVEFVKDLFSDKRYDWWSTHAGLDRWLAQLWKIVILSKECELRIPVPGRILGEAVSCYDLFYLKRLEDALNLAKMYEREVKRIRRLVHGTIGYVVNTVFDDILYSRVECRTVYSGMNVAMEHYLASREKTVRVEVEVQVPIGNGKMEVGSEINLDAELEKLEKRIKQRAFEVLPELAVKRSVRKALKLAQEFTEHVRG